MIHWATDEDWAQRGPQEKRDLFPLWMTLVMLAISLAMFGLLLMLIGLDEVVRLWQKLWEDALDAMPALVFPRSKPVRDPLSILQKKSPAARSL